MEADSLKRLIKKLELSDKDLFSFSNFVNSAEFFTEENAALFKDKRKAKKYNDIWFEMEILNAHALSIWEEQGCPRNFDIIWKADYEDDAKDLLNILAEFLKSVQS